MRFALLSSSSIQLMNVPMLSKTLITPRLSLETPLIFHRLKAVLMVFNKNHLDKSRNTFFVIENTISKKGVLRFFLKYLRKNLYGNTLLNGNLHNFSFLKFERIFYFFIIIFFLYEFY